MLVFFEYSKKVISSFGPKILDTKSNEYIFTKNVQADGKRNIPNLIDDISKFTRISLAEKAEEVEKNQKQVASITTKNLEAYKFYDIGEKALFSKKWSEAEENFQKAVEIDSNFALALYQLAYINQWFFSQKKADYYIARAVKNIETVPEKERLYIRAQSIKDYSSRIPVYEEIINKYPNEKQAYFEIGDMYFHNGPSLKSLPYFEKSLELDPSYENAIQHLGWMYLDIKDYQKYTELYERSLAIYPNDNSYKSAELYSHLYSGKFNVFLDKIRRLEEKDVQFLNTDNALGDAYLLSGNYAESRKKYENLILSDETKLTGYIKLRRYHAYRADYKNFIKYSDLILTHFISKNNYRRYVGELSRRSYALIQIFDRYDEAQILVNEITNLFADKSKNVGLNDLGFGAVFLIDSHKYLKNWKIAKEYDSQFFRNMDSNMQLDEGLRAKQDGIYADAIDFYNKGLNLAFGIFKNQAHYELSKLYYEVGDYENAVNVSDEIKIMTHQTAPRSREYYFAKYFLYSGLANFKLKNYRLAKSNLDIFLKIYEPASENLKYKKMARDAIADMKKLRS